MTTLLHSDSKRYSWWWDSHISPKNSKWLQENLTVMDENIKMMIKLLEEDADSFARRAEMYYKKRPELMKLVEEFYRAFRALAERYNHATGALRQAHRTMAEAFPNQIPPILIDDSPIGETITEIDPHTPDGPHPIRSFLDPEDLQKDTYGFSSYSQGTRNRRHSDVGYGIPKKKSFSSGVHSNFAEGKLRKGLTFQEEEREMLKQNGNRDKRVNELQDEVSQLSNENQNLKTQVVTESERTKTALSELQSLQDSLGNLKNEREIILLQYEQSLKKISGLESETSSIREEVKKLSEEIQNGATKLEDANNQCLMLEEVNQSMQLEVNDLVQKTFVLQEELKQKHRELEVLGICLEDEQRRSVKAESDLHSLQDLHTQSENEKKNLASELGCATQKLSEMEIVKKELEDEISKFAEENSSLKEQNSLSVILMKNLQDEILSLKNMKEKLEVAFGQSSEERNILQEEIHHLRQQINDLSIRHRNIIEQIEAEGLNVEFLGAFIRGLKDENIILKETYKKEENEKVLLLVRNTALENSLSDANVELEGTREKLRVSEGHNQSLLVEKSHLAEENRVLISQIENMSHNMESFSEKNMVLENSLSNLNSELEVLQEKCKKWEDCFQSLYNEKLGILRERDNVVSQLECLQRHLKDIELSHSELETKNSHLEKEKECLIQQVNDIEIKLKLEKEENKSFSLLSNAELTSLKKRICILEEENQQRKRVLHEEQNNIFSVQMSVFLLQCFINDLTERNWSLSVKCEDQAENLACSEKLISELEQRILEQNISITKIHMTLDQEKEKHLSSIESHDVQIANLENQIHVVQNENWKKKRELQNEQDNNFCIAIDNFLLERCLYDLKKSNFHVSIECQKHFDGLIVKERINSELQNINLCHQVEINKLKELLELENKQYTSSVLSSKIQFTALENHFNLLKEECLSVERAFKEEMDKVFSAHVENFVLQRCIHDLTELNSSLMVDYMNQVKADANSKNLISKLETQILDYQQKLMSLSDEKLKMITGILDVLASVGINMEESSWTLILHQMQGKIEERHKFMLDLQDVRLILIFEKSINDVLLRQLSLDGMDLKSDMCVLEKEFDNKRKEVLMLQAKNYELSEIIEQLRREIQEGISMQNELKSQMGVPFIQFSDLQCSYESVKKENEKLHGENCSLMNGMHNLKEKIYDLEEEVGFLIEEAIILGNFSSVFENFSHEKVMDIKMLENDLLCSHVVNGELINETEVVKMENHHLKESVNKLEEFKDRSFILEHEMNTIKDLFAELYNQIKHGKYLLSSEEMEPLSSDFESIEVKFNEAKIEVKNLTNKILCLSESNTQKEQKISNLLEVNEELQLELIKLRTREENLRLELERKRAEFECWETETGTLHDKLLSSSVLAMLYEEKIFELIEKAVHLEFSFMILKKILEEGMCSSDKEIKYLRRKVSRLEGENRGLNDELNKYLPQILSLKGNLFDLENRVCSLSKNLGLESSGLQKDWNKSLQNDSCISSPREDPWERASTNISELLALEFKIKTIDDILNAAEQLMMEEKCSLNSQLEAAAKEIAMFKSENGHPKRENGQIDVESQPHKNTDNVYKSEIEILNERDTILMKDIQLDPVSGPSSFDRNGDLHERNLGKNVDTHDQMLGLWEDTEQISSFKPVDENIGFRSNSQSQSDLPPVENIGTIRKPAESIQERIKLMARLDSDKKRLMDLQRSVQELKKKTEKSTNQQNQPTSEIDSARKRLNEIEESISHLLDTNRKLAKKTEDPSVSLNSKPEEIRSLRKKQLSDSARIASEKIGSLEFEIQGIEFLLVKLVDQHGSKGSSINDSRRVLLRDYLYGKEEKRRSKRILLCACIRPFTKRD